jgi:site-specific recombinase XerD
VLKLADRQDLGLIEFNLKVKKLLPKFLASRRQGIAPSTIIYYQRCLTPFTKSTALTPSGINQFLTNLKCHAGGKAAYYRAIRAFCNWLFKNDYLKDNPMRKVDPPKQPKRILPSMTVEQVTYLIGLLENPRDKAIISLFADSGMRLNELTCIRADDINWTNHTITIIGKGNKQRKAPFTERSAILLRAQITGNGNGENIWHMKRKSIQCFLRDLTIKTGIQCNAHSFRRGFACNLHRKGLSTLDIMHLGGWEDLSMVLRYTRSITFEDCLKHYEQVNN